MIVNPILPGFNPDPSILRVGDDYYIAVSSFEWFPGVPIYHSRDLKHWQMIDYALKTREMIDLQSLAPSCGVWAPCLSYNGDEKRFYLVYSNVYGRAGRHLEIDNFIIWAEDIRGPWSKPICVNSSGIDPSLFHEGRRKWVINQDRDFRSGGETRRIIILQEYDSDKEKLIGKPVRLTAGATVRGFTEGAHLYKRGEWYYLLTAEGGTGYGHCAAIQRSRTIEGPYEPCPHNPILTACMEDVPMETGRPYMMPEFYNPDMKLQKVGHASLVETQTGEWYMAHLCGRPIMPQQRCVLGRETALQKVEWTEDGWPKLAGGSCFPEERVPAPNLPEAAFPAEPAQIDFTGETLPFCFNTPRRPAAPDWVKAGGGHLRLRGGESLCSTHHPSIIARRVTAFKTAVTVKLRFLPDFYRHFAGLTFYYGSSSHYAFGKTTSEEGCYLTVCGMADGQPVDCAETAPVDKDGVLWLRGETDGPALTFSYSTDGEAFTALGGVFDMTALSDEACGYNGFTGAFVGMFAQDLHTRELWADFEYFEYIERDEL